MCNDDFIPDFGDDRELQEQMYQEAMYELQERERIEHLEYLNELSKNLYGSSVTL